MDVSTCVWLWHVHFRDFHALICLLSMLKWLHHKMVIIMVHCDGKFRPLSKGILDTSNDMLSHSFNGCRTIKMQHELDFSCPSPKFFKWLRVTHAQYSLSVCFHYLFRVEKLPKLMWKQHSRVTTIWSHYHRKPINMLFANYVAFVPCIETQFDHRPNV